MGDVHDPHWDSAWHWVCQSRKHAPPNADIWHLRWRWARDGEALFRQVKAGKYRLSPMLIHGRGKDAQAQWSAQDALVLKWVALHVQPFLPQPEACMHLRGKGVRQSLRQVAQALSGEQFAWVHRTDIRGYYANIRKTQILGMVSWFVPDPVMADLIGQYVGYSVEKGGEIHTPTKGIPRGCALSPLIGGALLRHIDGHFSPGPSEATFYARYMDDFLLFTRTRWQLRRGIGQLASFLDLSGFERHPDKTQTGKLGNGFDWLGVWFAADGPTIAPRALINHQQRRERLYEHARRRGMSHQAATERVLVYESRWRQWAERMLNDAQPD